MAKVQMFFFSLVAFVLVFVFTEYPKFQDFNDGLMRIYFLDVGQGDASLIKLPSKKLVLIDTGPSGEITETLSEYLPFTQSKIDLVILTHSHSDHITGLLDIIDNYEIGCIVYDMDDPSNSETEEHLRKKISDENIRVVAVDHTSDCFSDPQVSFTSHSVYKDPEIAPKIDKNQNLESIVTLVKFASFEALFTGDAEAEVQQKILTSFNENIEVLKVPHQGSRDGLYPPLLQKLLPDYAVFSVGKGNSYGHPHKEVTAEYSSLGIKSARTDTDGTVRVWTDGAKWGYTLEKMAK